VEGVLTVSKKARPAVEEEIKYLFMSNERNTGQYHNIKCEKILIYMNTHKQNGKAYFVELTCM